MFALKLGKLSCVLAVLTHASLNSMGKLLLDQSCGAVGGGGCGSVFCWMCGAGLVGGCVGGLVVGAGGGLVLLLCLELRLSPGGLDSNVSVCSSVLLLSSNSQHGTTM